MTMRASALAFNANLLYVQRGRDLLALDTGNGDVVLRTQSLPRSSSLAMSRLASRLLRLAVWSLAPMDDGSLVFVTKRRLCRVDAQGGAGQVFRISRGSRPLFLCHAAGGQLYFGEYFGNAERRAVHIYGSTDGGRSFHPVYAFPGGTVRHVHGVFADPYTGCVWVTTGDSDTESAIWVTDDAFRTLQRVAGGGQQQRAIQLLFTSGHIYYGTDAPEQQNYICRMARETGRIELLQAVDSPVFYGCMVDEYLFFSTGVEPSRGRRSRSACIWGSDDGASWRMVASYRKDLWPMKLFQYGQIRFPSGRNVTGRLWFTPVATQCDQTLQCIDVSDVFGSRRS